MRVECNIQTSTNLWHWACDMCLVEFEQPCKVVSFAPFSLWTWFWQLSVCLIQIALVLTFLTLQQYSSHQVAWVSHLILLVLPCLHSNIFSQLEVSMSFFDSSQSCFYKCSVTEGTMPIIACREESGVLPSMLGLRTGVGSSASTPSLNASLPTNAHMCCSY